MFGIKPRRTLALVMFGVLLVGMVSPVNAAPKASRQAPAPPGMYFTTEKEEMQRHEAFWKRINAVENRQKSASVRKNGGITAMYVNGDTRIDGPYFASGSGAISDDSTSGILNNIWDIFLTVLGFTEWETVGTIVSNVNLIYDVIIDQAEISSAESYHSYSYYLKDGDYYKNGSWYTGARVEQRVTYANGWSLYYDIQGVPHSNWEPQGWRYLTEAAGCHWNNNTWILGMAYDGYLFGSYVAEDWDDCSPWEP